MTQGYTPAGYSFTGTYDFENRLTLIQYKDSSGWDHQTEYTYNGNGIMTEKMVDGDESWYVLTGGLPSQERDGNYDVIREYTWGPNDGGGIGGLLSLNQGGQNYFYLYDGKGNVTAVIDSTQTVVATYAYDPFGKLMTKTGVLDQPYQFSTKPYDEKTGLSYYGYRFYSPEIGRWMTKDPLQEMGGGLNLYGFALNNPVNYADPTGEFIWVAIPIGIGLGILLGVAVEAVQTRIEEYEQREKKKIQEMQSMTPLCEEVGKEVGWKAAKKVAGSVSNPKSANEYKRLSENTQKTAKEGVDPYGGLMGNQINGIGGAMGGSE